MRTRLVLAVLPVALLGVTAPGSLAGPKEMKGDFNAAASPDPSSSDCKGTFAAARSTVPLKLPSAGTFKVELTGFLGDWDLAVEGKGGSVLGASAGFVEATTETVQVKVKKAMEITIVACNYAGGPTARGNYVFKPAK